MKKIFALVFCLAVGLFAKEWEQTIVIEPSKNHEWGFGSHGINDSTGVMAYWYSYEACLCDVSVGGCSFVLFWEGDYDQRDNFNEAFWGVQSVESLTTNSALNLDDTSCFDLGSSYVYEQKPTVENDTAYFVYKKDSSYYALCQYITVYDTVNGRDEIYGIPAYYAHQCVYQDDGTPTFSKIPMFTEELPKSSRKDINWSIPKRRPEYRTDFRNGLFLINGASSGRNRASHVQVEAGRVTRSLR